MEFASHSLRVEPIDLAQGLAVIMIPHSTCNPNPHLVNPHLVNLLRPLIEADEPVPREAVRKAVFGRSGDNKGVLLHARRRLNALLPPGIIAVEGRGDASLWRLNPEGLDRQPLDEAQLAMARRHAERYRLDRHNRAVIELIFQLCREWAGMYVLDDQEFGMLSTLLTAGSLGCSIDDSSYDFERLQGKLPEGFLLQEGHRYRLSDERLALAPSYILPGSRGLIFEFPEEGMAALPLVSRLLDSRGRMLSALSTLPDEADKPDKPDEADEADEPEEADEPDEAEEAEPRIALSSAEWMLGLTDFCPIDSGHVLCRYLFAVLLAAEAPMSLGDLRSKVRSFYPGKPKNLNFFELRAALNDLQKLFPHFSVFSEGERTSRYALLPAVKQQLVSDLGMEVGAEAMAHAVFYARKQFNVQKPGFIPSNRVPEWFDVSNNPFLNVPMDPMKFTQEWTRLQARLAARELVSSKLHGLVVPSDSEAVRALQALVPRALYLYTPTGPEEGEESFPCRFIPPKASYRYGRGVREKFDLGEGRVLVERASGNGDHGRLYGVAWTDLERLPTDAD